jgi:outer membrane protein OmpA-like peptidoglycan-associated protein
MKKRLDPWPSVSDLFSGLLVASFSGLIIFTAVHQRQIEIVSGERELISNEANLLVAKVQQQLAKAFPGGEVRSCGTDTCIEVYIEFELNSDLILPGEVAKVQRACDALLQVLSGNSNDRHELEIFIDGHTDQQQANRVSDPRERARFNWKLSAGRASSVLHEFGQCGVSWPEYRIVAVGYADKWRRCDENTEDCFRKNRRTTFRLRADTQAIAKRLAVK